MCVLLYYSVTASITYTVLNLLLLSESPNFSFLPYSDSNIFSILTPVHRSLNNALLACHRCPKKNNAASTM